MNSNRRCELRSSFIPPDFKYSVETEQIKFQICELRTSRPTEEAQPWEPTCPSYWDSQCGDQIHRRATQISNFILGQVIKYRMTNYQSGTCRNISGNYYMQDWTWYIANDYKFAEMVSSAFRISLYRNIISKTLKPKQNETKS